ncbi:MAG: hypothetical protein IPJ82_25285 [Lewinellaceae bacterium]|nr:hypothetical protein [Lewinellaceae bacterium]
MKTCNPFEAKCIEFEDTRPSVVLRDKKEKREYRAENSARKKLVCLRVDGCLIDTAQIKKCDYLLLVCPEKVAHFIELKGTDIKTAIQQLASAVYSLKEHLQQKGFKAINAKLALSRTPKIVPAKEWLDLRDLMKRYNGDAYRQNSPFNDIL